MDTLTCQTDESPAADTLALATARWQQSLERATAIIGRLAHDFGNHLTGIIGFAELAQSQVPANTLAQQYIKEVCHSGKLATSWLKTLQWINRRALPAFEPANLSDIVREQQARAEAEWDGAPQLQLDVAPDLPPVRVEGQALREALQQLLGNAREAIHGAGVVTLSARVATLSVEECRCWLGGPRPGPQVEISIQDTGTGFAVDQERLWNECFYSTKPRHRGLGLLVAFGIARGFGGGLRLGPHPQQGALVRLAFPAATPAPPTAPARPAGPITRILVVDDEPAVLKLINEVLTGAGFELTTMSHPREALAAFTRAPFDVVVTDIAMPDMSGFELASRLQAHRPATRFLFISGQESHSGAQARKWLRDWTLLRKPFDPPTLLSAVLALAGTPGGEPAK